MDLEEWKGLDERTVAAGLDALGEQIAEGFACVRVRRYRTGIAVATYRQSATGWEFNLIPGGVCWIGLTSAELEAARRIEGVREDILAELVPPQQVRVPPLLFGRLPVLEGAVRGEIELDEALFRPEFGDAGEPVPIYLSRSEVERICQRHSLDLPTEAEWEYVARGGTQSLFFFGDRLPDRAALGEKILAARLAGSVLEDIEAANPFGILGMFVGSWCKDEFRRRNDGVPEEGGYVVKGGGAALWPWQNVGEWMLCISAMRMSSKQLEDETCGAHLVRRVAL
jgi:formylglycine-generating enzyme required for sulfatase activity